MLLIKEHIQNALMHILYILYAIIFTHLISINILTLTTDLHLNVACVSLCTSLIFLIIAFKYVSSHLKTGLILSSVVLITYAATANTNFYNELENIMYVLLAFITIYILYTILREKKISMEFIKNSFITIIISFIVAIPIAIISYGLIYYITNILTLYLPTHFTVFVSFIIMLTLLSYAKYTQSIILKNILILTTFGIYITFIATNSSAKLPLHPSGSAEEHLMIICRFFSWVYASIIAYYAHHEK